MKNGFRFQIARLRFLFLMLKLFNFVAQVSLPNNAMATYCRLAHFSPILHFIQTPVMWFAKQVYCLVSIWNATLDRNRKTEIGNRGKRICLMMLKDFQMTLKLSSCLVALVIQFDIFEIWQLQYNRNIQLIWVFNNLATIREPSRRYNFAICDQITKKSQLRSLLPVIWGNDCAFIWGKVFKSRLSKFWGRHPLKNLLSPLLNTLSQMWYLLKILSAWVYLRIPGFCCFRLNILVCAKRFAL